MPCITPYLLYLKNHYFIITHCAPNFFVTSKDQSPALMRYRLWADDLATLLALDHVTKRFERQ